MPASLEWSRFFPDSTIDSGMRIVNRAEIRFERVGRNNFVAKVGDAWGFHEVHLKYAFDSSSELHWACTCGSLSPCEHAWAALLSIDQQLGRGHGTARKRRATTKGWKKSLEVVSAHLTHIERSRVAARQDSRYRRREAWYVLNITDCFERNELSISVYQRELRKSGDFGTFKRLCLDRVAADEFMHESDRELVTLFVGMPRRATSYYMPSYGGRESDRVEIPDSTYDVLLPRLCATGRLIWVLDSGLPVSEGKALAYDDGDPYTAQLRLEEVGSKWVLNAEFVRSQDTIALDEPVIVMNQGVIVMPDRIARLRPSPEFPWIAELRRTGPLVIPGRERRAFLKALAQVPRLPRMALPEQITSVSVGSPPTPCLVFEEPASARRSELLCGEVHFQYDEQRVPLNGGSAACLDEDGCTILIRNSEEENRRLSELRSIEALRRHNLDDAAKIFVDKRSFVDVVDQLTERGWVVEVAGKKLRRASSMRMSVRSDIDWFSLEGEAQFGDQTVPMPQVLAALRQRQSYVRLGDGSHGMLPQKWLDQLGTLADLAEAQANQVRFGHCQALLLDSLLADQPVEFDRGFEELRDRLREGLSATPVDPPETFRGTLREYQREGLGWLQRLSEVRIGGCLADDMGLGKTVQVLGLLEQRRVARREQAERGEAADTHAPSIVVVPKSLVFNWLDEAARFTPELRVVNYTGAGREEHLRNLENIDVLVTTYGTLRRDIVELRNVPFDYAILDEAQAIKNGASLSAKATRLLQARHRLAMTGTPVENHLGELWSLFEFLNPGMLGRGSSFVRLLRRGIDDQDELARVARGLRPFLLRRTKQQVLTELPPKSEQTLYCELSKKEQQFYNQLRDYYRHKLLGRLKKDGLEKSKMQVLEGLLRLRQAACHFGLLDTELSNETSTKLETLLIHLTEVIQEGHKALVFSQFTSLLSIVRKQLDERGVCYEYLDGSTRRRKACVERFQKDPNCSVFLISLKAGGHGLNLTAADYVFILDPWWNPAVEAQAVDRAHRIGQSQHVFAYRLIARGTVEEKIVELQQRKRQLAEAIISEDNSVLRNLTLEDVKLLFS